MRGGRLAKAGVLDFLPDLGGRAGLRMYACAHGLKFIRRAAAAGTTAAVNQQSTRQARPWRGIKPCCDEEYDRTRRNT